MSLPKFHVPTAGISFYWFMSGFAFANFFNSVSNCEWVEALVHLAFAFVFVGIDICFTAKKQEGSK